MTRFRVFTLTAALLAAGVAPLAAQRLPSEGPVATGALVNVESKNNAPLDPAMLKLEVNGHQAQVQSVMRVSPAAAQVAILIDDGLRMSFSSQLRDVQSFIHQLPAGTKVLVGYMQNGTVRSAGRFSADHQEIASELRMPLSSPGISASPYFCLSEFVKHWPSAEPGARFVLMITNGVDPYNGSTSPMNQNSPYVQQAQRDAQRAGVAVYSIYFGNSGLRGGRGSFSGQSYLQQVADATGGQLFNAGPINPVSVAPYLDSFRRAIGESYLVQFSANANGGKRNELTRIRLKTSQPGVKVHAPDGVLPGSNGQAIASR
ncbi:MAG TPA: hypothetical protein VM865_02625 [Acidobacteriaceae bacterium]|jgi:hypothetical protein|nr:hypothetical protein [Acidobacteriaceae bacterium]